MNRSMHVTLAHLDVRATDWLARHSVTLLRVSLGLVFLGFGLLKFFPDVSPAQDLAARTVDMLTFGLIPGGVATILVASLETTIGLSLVTGKQIRLGLALLGMAMIGVLSPLVLFPGDLFAREYNAPTLEGQYVLKDVVLLAGGLVVMARERGKDPISEGAHTQSDGGGASR
ncbi:MAG: DoxX family membrane protein [Thermomicrobiales bacterium]